MGAGDPDGHVSSPLSCELLLISILVFDSLLMLKMRPYGNAFQSAHMEEVVTESVAMQVSPKTIKNLVTV